MTAYHPWNIYFSAWDTREVWAICHCQTEHKATLHMTKHINSPLQTQSKLPRDCHTTQMDLPPPFHISDGSASVKSLTKTDSLGLHWVGASESFPPPTCTQTFLPVSHSYGPSEVKFCPVPWLHVTTEPNSLQSCDECHARCFPLLY